MRIIGCGNRERGDDGAGILVAEKLQKLGIEADTREGEAADLMGAWTGAEDVIVIDAVVTGAALGTVQVWNGEQPLVSLGRTASTHGFGVREAIELARVLNLLPTRLRVYGIEGKRFEVGTEISPEVRRGVEEVVRRISTEVARPHELR